MSDVELLLVIFVVALLGGALYMGVSQKRYDAAIALVVVALAFLVLAIVRV